VEDLKQLINRFNNEVIKMIRTENLPKNVVFVGNDNGFKYYVSLIDGTIYEVRA